MQVEGEQLVLEPKYRKTKAMTPYTRVMEEIVKKSLNRLNTKNWKCDFSLQPALKINKMLWWGR